LTRTPRYRGRPNGASDLSPVLLLPVCVNAPAMHGGRKRDEGMGKQHRRDMNNAPGCSADSESRGLRRLGWKATTLSFHSCACDTEGIATGPRRMCPDHQKG
jgi:hypothetical protein